jgi:hypothetical protein
MHVTREKAQGYPGEAKRNNEIDTRKSIRRISQGEKHEVERSSLKWRLKGKVNKVVILV